MTPENPPERRKHPGPPKRDPDEILSKWLSVKISQKDFRRIQQAAADKGVSIHRFCRDAILAQLPALPKTSK
jgi:hypothetical protein